MSQVTSLPAYDQLPAEELHTLKRTLFVVMTYSMSENYPDFIQAHVIRSLFLEYDPEIKGSTPIEKEKNLQTLLTGEHRELIFASRLKYEPVAEQAVDYGMTAMYEDEAYRPFLKLLKEDVVLACVNRARKQLH